MKLRAACCAAAALLACTSAWATSTVGYPGLGKVEIEQPPGTPVQVVIFLSGDGGWNKGVVDMARHLAQDGALVAGVDVRQIARGPGGKAGSCLSLAGTLEGLSHHVQQKYGLPMYQMPILVGYSSGATLAYATLAQAPPGTFKGAISLGFCPDLEWSTPLCRGAGLEHDAVERGFLYRPAAHLQEPWIALQGEQDQVCAATQTREFVAHVPRGTMVPLPDVGHGYSVERNWLPQFTQAFREIAATGETARERLPVDVRDLPLVEMPSQDPTRDRFAIMLSGDGGWAGLDREVAAELNSRGVPVVGWDSLRYFWNARTPDEAARDLDRVIRYYGRRWNKSQVLLLGYSQGADVLPFMLNRLPEVTRGMIAGGALIAVSGEAFFKFSMSHWIASPTGGLPVAPEVDQGRLARFSCIYGAEEEDSPCRRFDAARIRRVELPGGHHFDGDYARVARAVLEGTQP